jgi:Spc19
LCQFYILVNERTVREYKADITEAIEPQIKELIERAEKGLKLLERRESSLQAKVSFLFCLYILLITNDSSRSMRMGRGRLQEQDSQPPE